MPFETAFIVLFCVATTVALLVRRFRVPYTVALVLAGLAIGALRLFEAPHLTKELLFAVFLPGLLFEAAFHIDAERLRENTRVILSLAMPGVIVAIGFTGLITTWIVHGLALDPTFTLSHGLVFGALVAATDPIAVIALFKTLQVPGRLALLVEGESLLNDGSAVVFFALILSVVTGQSTSAGSLVSGFAASIGGGVLVGLAIGFAVSQVTHQVDEPMIEISLTVIAAYGAFVVAEQMHSSGVLATVASGLVCGNLGRRHGMSPSTHLAVVSFWEYAAFALNSMVFLLIGFEVSVGALALYWREIAVAFLAMLLVRFVVVGAVVGAVRRTNEAVPKGWGAVIAWGGIRGGLSIVLALGLPRDLPHREQLVTMTLGVVLASILLQGLTMAPLLRRLGLVVRDVGRSAYERARAELRVVTGALSEIEDLDARRMISPDDARVLRAPYEQRRDDVEAVLSQLGPTPAEATRMQRSALHHLLAYEARAAAEGLRSGAMSPEVFEAMARDVATRRLRLSEADAADAGDVLGPLSTSTTTHRGAP